MQPGVQRVTYLDYSRGILICLVTVGHSLQHLVLQDQNFYSDGMFKFIYIFHMPLFMAICGYVAFPSINRMSFGAFLKRKTKSYLVPILAWALIWTTFALAVGSNTLMNVRLSGFLLDLAGESPRLWFLWALLGSLLLAWLGNSMGRYRVPAFLVVFACVLLLPDRSIVPLFKYMFPFFVGGLFLASVDLSRVRRSHVVLLTVLSGVVSVVCYAYWKDTTYIYVSGMSLAPQHVPVLVFRYVASAVTCVSVAGLIFLAQPWTPARLKAWIETAGRDCIYIYILQVYAFGVLARLSEHFFQPIANPALGHVVAIAFGLLMTFGCWLVGSFLSRNATSAQVLFGRSPRLGLSVAPLAADNPRL